MLGRSNTRLFYTLLFAFTLFVVISCGNNNNDGAIQTAINSKTQTDPDLASISATVDKGTVVLTGTCPDEKCRTNAEKAIKDVDGVKKVINNIAVAPSQVTADEPLRQSLKQVMDRYDGIQADVQNGVITLRGTIKDRERLQQLMIDLQALHPRRIDNQLLIKD